METTNHLNLPYIMAAQAQKHVTHNEAIRMLDTLVQMTVETASLASPPPAPAEGQCYIVAAPAAGDWVGKEGRVAAWQDGAWMYFEPIEGWICFVRDTAQLLAYASGVWGPIVPEITELQNADFVGVNTTADTTNRLSVSSDAVLFSNAGTDQRTKINKAAESDTASLLFQTQFSGRAELGLMGEDDFSFKVSANGATFSDAIKLNRASGEARFPANSMTEHYLSNLFNDGGRMAVAPETSGIVVGAFAAPDYLTPYNGSSFAAAGQFIHNNATFGGTAATLDAETEALITKLKTTTSARRYGPEFHIMRVSGGTGMAASVTTNGTTRYLSFTNPSYPLMVNSTWGINVRAETKSIAIAASSNNELYVDGYLQPTTLVIAPSDGWKQLVFVGVRLPQEATDYDTALFRIYGETQTDILLALPFLTPAQIRPKPGELFGRVPTPAIWG